MAGASMMPMLRGESETTHGKDHVIGWELFGKTAIRQGDWKIIQIPITDPWRERSLIEEPHVWQLFNLANDPTEMTDLAASNPDKLSEMIELWDQYESDFGVIVPDQTDGY